METPHLEDLCRETPQLNLNKDSKFVTSRTRVASDESDDGSPNYQVTPYYEPLPSDDESDTSPLYPPETILPYPWEVSLAFAPEYLRIEPKLFGDG
jgi:hypothetical protein